MCGLDQGFNKIIALAYSTTGRKAWQPHFCFNEDVCVLEKSFHYQRIIAITNYYLKYNFLCFYVFTYIVLLVII